MESCYKYIKHGFEGILYDAENGDDRLIIVIQGLKGVELPSKYAKFFCEKGYSALAMSYYGAEGQQTMNRFLLNMMRSCFARGWKDTILNISISI